jgi:molybdopterin converting factor small subunit
MITVRLPPSLRASVDDLLLVPDDVPSIAALVDALDRRVPGFRDQFEQGGFNLAVNDELLLFRVRDRALHPGDVVEIVPTIAGG